MAKLSILVIDGIHIAGKRFNLSEDGEYVVGRGEDCSILIPKTTDKSISRSHCLITIKGKDVFISDCGSCNGTFVNGLKTISETEGQQKLNNGDKIKIGSTVLLAEIEEEKTNSEEPEKVKLKIAKRD